VDEARPGDVGERLAEGRLDAAAVDLADRPGADAQVAQPPALAGVERAEADERDTRAIDGGQRPVRALELRPA
jgi:hypothetical protein